MAARLIERGGEHDGATHVLQAAVTTIGRGEENDIVIHAGHVSRRHAQVCWDGARFILHDLGSKNGTLLNDARITQPRPLESGDVITLPGATPVTLLFDLAEETVTWRIADATRAGVWIDLRTATVTLNGRPIHVSTKEYLALALLFQKSGALVSKEELAASVWPEYQGAVADYSIEQLISRLRRKLEADPDRPRYVMTVRGLGYRLIVT